MVRILYALGTCAALGLGAGGCYAEPYGAGVELTSAPVDIEASPYVVYGGRPTYWYGNRWYYRDGPRWRYYSHEPRMLYRHRRHWR